MRKRLVFGIILAMVFLSGCAGEEQSERGEMKEREVEREESREGDTKEGKTGESEIGEGETGEGKISEKKPGEAGKESDEKVEKEENGFLAGVQERGYSVLEDEEAFYACSDYRIYRLDKKGNEWSVIWESEAATGEEYGLDSGSAILTGDTIYFTGMVCEGESGSALFRIKTDGSGEEYIDGFEKDVDTLFLRDGILYATAYGGYHVGYVLKADGSAERLHSMENTLYGKVPEEYREPSFCNSDDRYFSVPESDSFYGFSLLYNAEGALVKFDPETGKVTVLATDCILRSFNKEYLLLLEYAGDGWSWYLADVDTMELRLIAEGDNKNAIMMDEDYIYWEKREIRAEETYYVYERMTVETGETTPFFEIKDPGDIISSDLSPCTVLPPEIHDGYLYYVSEEDYKLYLKRRDINDPAKEESLGEAYYDSGISALGYIEAYQETIYSNAVPDFELVNIDLERLVIEEEFAGADEINRILKEYQDGIIAYAKESTGDYREEALAGGEYGEEDDGAWMMQYRYWCDLAGISYFDGNYTSFYLSESMYEGGIHGMPYRTGFTFDLKTGKRLMLPDLIGNSEEELKEIVTKYFKAYIDLNPRRFWDDAVDTVREYTGYDSDFYLTKKGIRFYFGPYALASYADGFQEVTIPYSEFDMRIPVLDSIYPLSE